MIKHIFGIFTAIWISTPAMANDFGSWVGEWSGTCQLDGYNSDIPKRTLGMALTIAKVDDKTYSWKIQYEGEPVRDYKMVRQNDLAGHWILDENSGIFIDHFIYNDELTSQYLINGRFFVLRSKIVGNTLTTEDQSYWAASPRQSSFNGGAPIVYSFALRDRTRCKLERAN